MKLFEEWNLRRNSLHWDYRRSIMAVLLALCTLSLCLTASGVRAQTSLNPPLPFVRGEDGQPDFTALDNGAGIIKSRQWALALGKALFWDVNAGSDGNSCASCHFHAGADPRLKNQLNPGFNDITRPSNIPNGPTGDYRFGSV
jgi:cytochrome c peroxidase